MLMPIFGLYVKCYSRDQWEWDHTERLAVRPLPWFLAF